MRYTYQRVMSRMVTSLCTKSPTSTSKGPNSHVKTALHARQKSPTRTSKKHHTRQRAPGYPQKSLIYPQRSPIYPQQSPTFPQKSSISTSNGPFTSSFSALRRSMPFCRFKSAEKASHTPGKWPKYTSKEPCMLKPIFIFSVEAIHNFLEIQIRGKSLKYE